MSGCVVILMWHCLVWVDRSTPDNFGVPSHRFNSATGEQKGIIQIIYTDSELPSRMPNSLIPSAKLRSANLPFLRLWCDAVRTCYKLVLNISNAFETVKRYPVISSHGRFVTTIFVWRTDRRLMGKKACASNLCNCFDDWPMVVVVVVYLLEWHVPEHEYINIEISA